MDCLNGMDRINRMNCLDGHLGTLGSCERSEKRGSGDCYRNRSCVNHWNYMSHSNMSYRSSGSNGKKNRSRNNRGGGSLRGWWSKRGNDFKSSGLYLRRRGIIIYIVGYGVGLCWWSRLFFLYLKKVEIHLRNDWCDW